MILQNIIQQQNDNTAYYIKADLFINESYQAINNYLCSWDSIKHSEKSLLGNSLLIECKEAELHSEDKFKRTIKAGKFHFLNAQLFVKHEGQFFKLKHQEGFLKLDLVNHELKKLKNN